PGAREARSRRAGLSGFDADPNSRAATIGKTDHLVERDGEISLGTGSSGTCGPQPTVSPDGRDERAQRRNDRMPESVSCTSRNE
ncbi:MAG: hypothetical protein WB524_03240, partial [Acidobacteriaceae bacterium]